MSSCTIDIFTKFTLFTKICTKFTFFTKIATKFSSKNVNLVPIFVKNVHLVPILVKSVNLVKKKVMVVHELTIPLNRSAGLGSQNLVCDKPYLSGKWIAIAAVTKAPQSPPCV